MAPRPKKQVEELKESKTPELKTDVVKELENSRTPELKTEIVKEPKTEKVEEVKTPKVEDIKVAEPVVKAPERFVVPPSANAPIVMNRQNNMRPGFAPRFNNFNNRQGFSRPIIASEPIVTEELIGIFDQTGTDGRGIVRSGFRPGETDAVLPAMMARQLKLRAGDVVTGQARKPKENEPYWSMMQVTK